MNYNGIELKEITEPQIFNPPEKMLVWDSQDERPTLEIVYAITTEATFPVVINREEYGVYDAKMFCAKIPEEPKPRRATIRELAKWLAQGNGELSKEGSSEATTLFEYGHGYRDEAVAGFFLVRKWDDTDWHEPTADYMNLEEK